MSREAAKLDVEGYRDMIAPVVGIGVDELTTTRRDDPRSAMLRMVAAYVLLRQDKLSLDSIAQIMGENESWARSSTDYVARRIGHYYAFKLYVDGMLETYARVRIEAGKVSGLGVDGVRKRIADAVGITVAELVATIALELNNDAEIIQKVAAYLLLSKDKLSVTEVAEVMCKPAQWALSAKDYVERHVKREQGLKDFVARTGEAYLERENTEIGGSKSLAPAKR
jgi:hypothetical protein